MIFLWFWIELEFDLHQVCEGIISTIESSNAFTERLGRTGIDLSPQYFPALIQVKTDFFQQDDGGSL
jgi:hypothetical protein